MPSDGQVVFEITGDNRPMNQALKDTTADIEKESKKWDKAAAQSTDSMGSSFTSMFKTISVAAAAAKVGQVLLDWGKQAIQAASDLEEVQNVVDTTFGESGAAKIETWAQNAGKQFGLTETQAKKFTSTLGAMFKSAGMAGPEIVTMSEDLAGLAADMASFYNLDFETAFQKIRSGISGETEPLKQLGINMSVANLEAFALEKGITKAFNAMSQSEQTMLRYQYLMQATADAQGDFARTSDGYANGLRMLETNLEQLKTNVGNIVLPMVSQVVGAINGMFDALRQDLPQDTVMDKFASIDLDTETKIKQIQGTAEEARVLIGVLNDIKSDVASKNLEDVATSANKLDMGAGTRWGNLISALQGAGVISEEFGGDEMKAAGDNLWDLGFTANNRAPEDDKVSAWKSLLGALKENAEALSAYTGTDAEATIEWLNGLESAVDEIDPSDVEAWESLFNQLQRGLPNLNITEADVSNIGAFADNVDKLKLGTGTKWKSLLDAMQESGILKTSFNDATVADNIETISKAFSENAPEEDKVGAWSTLLSTLTANAEGLSTLTGQSAEETKKWLEDLAAGANKLDATKAESWSTLFSSLVEGLPGLGESDAGKAFFDNLAGYFLAMGSDSAEAKAGLMALGLSTDEINAKQKQWLETCRRLVQTIPGLSEIINAQTGEVRGGIGALEEYVDEWQNVQTALAELDAINRKKAALKDSIDVTDLEVDVKVQKGTVDNVKAKLDEINAAIAETDAKMKELGGGGEIPDPYANPDELQKLAEEQGKLLRQQEAYSAQLEKETKELDKRQAALDRTNAANTEAAAELEKLENYEQQLIDTLHNSGVAAEESAGSIKVLSEAQADAARTALNELAPALATLADYYEDVRKATAQQVGNVIGGFEKIITPADQARQKVADLKKELTTITDKNKKGEIDIRIADAENSIASAQSMAIALEQQLEYINKYKDNLEEAKRRNVSADLLAQLSDGSVESADYLAALATASEEEIKRINEAFASVQEGKATFVDILTEQKLAADKTFEEIVAKANETVSALDMADGTYDAAHNTVEGIARGIGAALGDVTAQVDAVMAQLERLSSFNGISFASGAFSLTGSSGLDYSALGDTIKNNTPQKAGHVYLNGKLVGQAVSAAQAAESTSLVRSGWIP